MCTGGVNEPEVLGSGALPLGSCWLQGRAEFMEEADCGHTMRS